MILAIFDLQVIPMLPAKFRVNWPFSSEEEEAKNWFSGWPQWRPSWISNREDFSYFWFISHPNASYQVWSQLASGFRRRSECFLPSFESIGLSVQKKKQKIDFQNGRHGGHLGFPIGRILANFDLQVTLMLPTLFKVNKPLGSWEEAKNRFSRWPPWRPC